MSWSTRVFDTMTGDLVLALDAEPAQANWSRRIGAEGDGRHVFKPSSLELSPVEIRALFEGQSRTIAVCWGHHVAYAGVIQRTIYSRDDDTLDFDHQEIRTFLRARMTGGVSGITLGDLNVASKSYSGVVRAVVARAMQWSFEWVLPIDLPADGVGALGDLWDWWRFVTIDDILAQLEDEGVEVDFEPYIHADGRLRWRTLVGQPIVGAITDLPVSAGDSNVTGLKVTVDASQQVTGVLVAGEGTEAGTVTVWAGAPGSNIIPIRDVYRSQRDISDSVRLQAIADAEFEAFRLPLEQWSFSTQHDDEFPPELVAPGRVLHMDVRDDAFIPNGLYVQRVIALSGGLGLTVTPEVQRHGA